MGKGRGFTLIELLVVIAIVALLFGILMPALRMAREQGRRSVCGQNEKNMALGLIMYGNDYDGKLPKNEVERWLFDVSYWTTDILMQAGGFDRHTFYCPSYPGRDRILFWRYGENLPAGTTEGYPKPEPQDDATRKDYHRIIGYFWLIETRGGRPHPPMTPEGGTPKEWVKSLIDTKQPPAMVELIVDSTCSDGGDRTSDFTGATGGVMSRWGLYDKSNHVKGTRCTGANVAFVDGHVQWRKFDEMQHRWRYETYTNPCFWW
ncbi:MAG: DUF1559 domain-containing protein [Phycisphaerales bacterium]|nr:MAG: DUF1559 domain-containing protein [Phycisphaerales bacterium]